MTSKDEGKIALDEYEEFKMMSDFLSRIQVVNWLNTGIPPIFYDELMRLKEVVEAKGGALPLILQEMLNPEDLGEMNIGVDLVKDRKLSQQKTMLPNWDAGIMFSTDNWFNRDDVIPSYGWLKYCYPHLWHLILRARIGPNVKGSNKIDQAVSYWQSWVKLAENKALSNLFNKAFIYYACSDYKTPIGIIVNTEHTINGKDVKYYKGQPLNIQDTVRFKGASTMNSSGICFCDVWQIY